MPNNFIDALKRVMGNEAVFLDPSRREEYATDKCPRNLLEKVPACAVAIKIDKKNYKFYLSALIYLAKKYDQKIITRGGGSGVCGALTPYNPSNTVIVDLTDLNEVFEINLSEHYVTVGAGIMGSDLEDALRKNNRTIGHSPASLAISTPGGWIATRSSGQFSSRYGNIEDLVLGIEIFTADGQHQWTEKENLKNFLRMEGTSGIITKVKMKIFPCSPFRKFMAFSFPGIKTGVETMEKLFLLRFDLEKRDIFLSSLRIYDPLDFKVISKPGKKEAGVKSLNKWGSWIEKTILGFPRITNFVAKVLKRPIMILVLESDSERGLRSAGKEIRTICLENKGREENDHWSETWYANRFKLNYEKIEQRVRDGIVVDTFDCLGTFAQLPTIYSKVTEAVANLAIVGAHFGMDRKTPYIYFTFAAIAKNKKSPVSLYDQIWFKILEACRQNGGLTTHHHGIGLLKAGLNNSLVPFAYGPEWLKQAREAKEKYDPRNLFNPNKIF